MLRPGLVLRFAVLLLVAGVAVVVTAVVGVTPPEPTAVRTLLPPPAFDPPAVNESLFDQVSAAESEPTATAEPPSDSPVARLVIPAIGVDASVVVLSVDGDGVMQSPSTPTEVAWYDFSARPGRGSNAVFAGHVDYHDYGAAVFWHLRRLAAGDAIIVLLADGTEYRYAVVSAESYGAEAAPIQEIVGRTAEEVVTLITCGGSFDASARAYDQRLVVRAQRVASDQVRAP